MAKNLFKGITQSIVNKRVSKVIIVESICCEKQY